MTAAARPRALVLAAGLGTRLRPLTEAVPKPLLPVRGVSILARTLRQLAAAGCAAAAINLHYRGAQIRAALGDTFDGMPLTWSEEPQLLGTLGALGPLAAFAAAADPLLIVNGDSLCRWPLAQLLRRHRERQALATLLVATRPDPADFGGGVAVAPDGRLVAFRRPTPPDADTVDTPGAGGGGPGGGAAIGADADLPLRWRVFAGVHVLSPRLLPRIAALLATPPPPRVADTVRDLYEPLLAEQPGSIVTLATRRPWHDLGTPRRFLAACLDPGAVSVAGEIPPAGRSAGSAGGGTSVGEVPAGVAADSWISPSAVVAADARIVGSTVEAGCRVESGAVIEASVLLPGARVAAGCTVLGTLLGPGAELAAGRCLAGALLAAGAAPLPL